MFFGSSFHIYIYIQISLNVECQKILMQGVRTEDCEAGSILTASDVLSQNLLISSLNTSVTLVRLHHSIIARKHNLIL